MQLVECPVRCGAVPSVQMPPWPLLVGAPQHCTPKGEYQTRCTRSAYLGVVAWSLIRGYVLLAPMLLPQTVPDTAEGTWAVQPHAKLGLVGNNLSSLSLLLHWVHVSSPKGALTPSHDPSPSNLHQGTVFTRASKVDQIVEKLFKYQNM